MAPEVVEDLGVVSITAQLYHVLMQNGRRQITSQISSRFPLGKPNSHEEQFLSPNEPVKS